MCLTSEDHNDRCILLLYAISTSLQLQRSAVPAPVLTTPCVSSCDISTYCGPGFAVRLIPALDLILEWSLPEADLQVSSKETPSLAWPKAAEVILAYEMMNTGVGKGRCQYHD